MSTVRIINSQVRKEKMLQINTRQTLEGLSTGGDIRITIAHTHKTVKTPGDYVYLKTYTKAALFPASVRQSGSTRNHSDASSPEDSLYASGNFFSFLPVNTCNHVIFIRV